MNGFSLVPKDSLTQRLLVDVIAKMIMNDIAAKRTAATSEFPRPDVATADTQPTNADAQLNSTTVAVSGQNNERTL